MQSPSVPFQRNLHWPFALAVCLCSLVIFVNLALEGKSLTDSFEFSLLTPPQHADHPNHMQLWILDPDSEQLRDQDQIQDQVLIHKHGRKRAVFFYDSSRLQKTILLLAKSSKNPRERYRSSNGYSPSLPSNYQVLPLLI